MQRNHVKIEGSIWGGHKPLNLSQLQIIQYLNATEEDRKLSKRSKIFQVDVFSLQFSSPC